MTCLLSLLGRGVCKKNGIPRNRLAGFGGGYPFKGEAEYTLVVPSNIIGTEVLLSFLFSL